MTIHSFISFIIQPKVQTVHLHHSFALSLILVIKASSLSLYPWYSFILKKTRKLGICILISLAIGAIFTSLFLKNAIGRHRPYLSGVDEYYNWWKYVGGLQYKEFSFPSGHTTATMAVMMCIFLTCNKKYSWLVFIFVALMGLSRNYFMVHYPTDILGGIMVGGISGIISYLICYKSKLGGRI